MLYRMRKEITLYENENSLEWDYGNESLGMTFLWGMRQRSAIMLRTVMIPNSNK